MERMRCSSAETFLRTYTILPIISAINSSATKAPKRNHSAVSLVCSPVKMTPCSLLPANWLKALKPRKPRSAIATVDTTVLSMNQKRGTNIMLQLLELVDVFVFSHYQDGVPICKLGCGLGKQHCFLFNGIAYVIDGVLAAVNSNDADAMLVA